MLKTIPAAEAKNKFGLLMDTVQREAIGHKFLYSGSY